MKALYIHGFNGSPDGSTGTFVKKFFGEENVVAPQLDLLDYRGTLSLLEKLIADNGIELIVSHSFGAFYALALRKTNLKTVVANPCMIPSLEIPKLDGTIPAQWACEFKEIENKLYSEIPEEVKNPLFGIFADGDELFSYGEFFKEKFGAEVCGRQNQIGVQGNHKIPEEEMKKGLEAALSYFNKLNRA